MKVENMNARPYLKLPFFLISPSSRFMPIICLFMVFIII